MSEGANTDNETCRDRKLEADVSTEEIVVEAKDGDIPPGSKADPENAAKHNYQTSS